MLELLKDNREALSLLTKLSQPLDQDKLAQASELKYSVIMKTREVMTARQAPAMVRSAILHLLLDTDDRELVEYCRMILTASEDLRSIMAACGIPETDEPLKTIG